METIRSNTTVKVFKANLLWELEHYSVHDTKGDPVKSPIFTSEACNHFKWYMKLYPNSKTNTAENITVFLYLDASSHYKSVFARSKLHIIDNEQNKLFGRTSSVHEYAASPVHGYQHPRGWTDFIKRDQLLLNPKLLPNNKLTLCCEVSFFRVSDDLLENMCNQHDTFLLQLNASEYDLSKDLRSLLENQQFADVVVSINSKNYPVHKAILAARSPVFSAMFQHDMLENEHNRIVLIDVEERVVEEMLRYIYTGFCENLKSLADGLLTVADKYDLEGLKVICQDALIENLSVENVTQILVLADLHRADKLKSKALSYIVSKSSKVMKSAGWKLMAPSNPQLIMEVSEALSKALHREKKNHSCKRIKFNTRVRDIAANDTLGLIRNVLPVANNSNQ